MAKLKGIKKLNKAISTELTCFQVQAVLEESFGMYVDDKIVGYALTHSIIDEYFDDFVFKTFGFAVGENDFVLSLLHEIGHLQTLKDIEQETYEKCQEKIEKIENKLAKDNLTEKKEKNLHFKYFALPTEIVATAWAVAWARKHPKKYKKMCENTLTAIKEFYKVNGVTEETA